MREKELINRLNKRYFSINWTDEFTSYYWKNNSESNLDDEYWQSIFHLPKELTYSPIFLDDINRKYLGATNNSVNTGIVVKEYDRLITPDWINQIRNEKITQNLIKLFNRNDSDDLTTDQYIQLSQFTDSIEKQLEFNINNLKGFDNLFIDTLKVYLNECNIEIQNRKEGLEPEEVKSLENKFSIIGLKVRYFFQFNLFKASSTESIKNKFASQLSDNEFLPRFLIDSILQTILFHAKNREPIIISAKENENYYKKGTYLLHSSLKENRLTSFDSLDIVKTESTYGTHQNNREWIKTNFHEHMKNGLSQNAAAIKTQTEYKENFGLSIGKSTILRLADIYL